MDPAPVTPAPSLLRRLGGYVDRLRQGRFRQAVAAARSGSAADVFHAYASWLVSLSWVQFFLLSGLLLVVANLMEDLPPFSWVTWRSSEEVVDKPARRAASAPQVPRVPATAPAVPAIRAVPPAPAGVPVPPAAPALGSMPPDEAEAFIRIQEPLPGEKVELTVDKRGLRIGPRRTAAPVAAVASASAGDGAAREERPGVVIRLPPGADADTVREKVQEAVDEAKRDIEEAVRDAEQARREADEARREAEDARREALDQAQQAQREASQIRARTGTSERRVRVHNVRLGDFLVNTALIFIFVSAAIKLVYKGRIQAEVKAAQATEVAEAESLKRQVVEARMAAMQAQVEPHFLFNTLASIDHLIETDPRRASQMQQNLIALLRAAMPSMREANALGTRDLGRELAVIRPYLEILKVRMEDRLRIEIQVSEGLHSAVFPPMMLQSLVENAIKHGLEPKPDGGVLTVRAEIVHGKLAVTVADTGLGFGKAATAGTGTGLANIRERLQLLHGTKAQLRITGNAPSGTVVTITVPYELHTEAQAQAAAGLRP